MPSERICGDHFQTDWCHSEVSVIANHSHTYMFMHTAYLPSTMQMPKIAN